MPLTVTHLESPPESINATPILTFGGSANHRSPAARFSPMFPNQAGRPLVHLPRQQSQTSPDSQLPRGECRFIVKDVDQDGGRQRCSCVSFCLNNSVPGSQCGCGHNAWHHITEPAGDFVTHDESRVLIDRIKYLEEQSRIQNEEIRRERVEKERMLKDLQQVQHAWYQNLYNIRLYMDQNVQKLRMETDDKIEGIEDKVHLIESLTAKFTELDEAVMRLEEKSDSGRRTSRSLTPLVEGQTSPPRLQNPELPLRIGRNQHPDAWDVKVILLPTRHMKFAYPIDSVAYRRCSTRGLHQQIHLQDHSNETFLRCCETSFMAIFRRRPWMPLQCLKSSDMSLAMLSHDAMDATLWDYNFLEQQCLAHDKLLGDVIFIALQQEDLSWDDIRALPRVFASDESCWEHDDQLDGPNKADPMDTDHNVETESAYEYNSPPPYTSRASMHSADTPRQQPIRTPAFALDMLATASLAGHRGIAPSISERSNYSAPSIISERSNSTIGSIDSIALSEADEHRSKRTKLPFLKSPSQPSLHGGMASAPSSPPHTQIVSSGRTKRKMAATKVKEPLNWGMGTRELSFKSIMHRDRDGRRPQTSGGHSQAESSSTNEP